MNKRKIRGRINQQAITKAGGIIRPIREAMRLMITMIITRHSTTFTIQRRKSIVHSCITTIHTVMRRTRPSRTTIQAGRVPISLTTIFMITRIHFTITQEAAITNSTIHTITSIVLTSIMRILSTITIQLSITITTHMIPIGRITRRKSRGTTHRQLTTITITTTTTTRQIKIHPS